MALVPQEIMIGSWILREDYNNRGTFFEAQVDGINMDQDPEDVDNYGLSGDDDILLSTKDMATMIPLSMCKGIPMTQEWMDRMPLTKSLKGFYTLDGHQKERPEPRFILVGDVVHCSLGDDDMGVFYAQRITVHGLQGLLFQLSVNY